MSAHLLVFLSLATSTDAPAAAFNASTLATTPWSAEDLRTECRETVVRALKPQSFQPDRDVPDLVLLRAAVAQTQELPRGERIQTIRRIDYCLEKSLAILERQHARLTKTGSKGAASKPGSNSEYALAGGAAEARQAQQLISLIEATIQPETWQSNGGLGVIQYWPPGYALVIRNTQAVHEEIGGLISQLEASTR